MLPIVGMLLEQGLSLIGNAVLAKGKDVIEQATGVKLDESKPLSNEDVLKLKQYELEHEEELLRLQIEDNKLDLEAYKIQVADTSNARDRELKINESVNASWLAKNTSSLLALGFTVIFLALGFLSVFDVGVNYREAPFNSVYNTMGQIIMLIVGYYWGSSKDLKANDPKGGVK